MQSRGNQLIQQASNQNKIDRRKRDPESQTDRKPIG